ncbi:MAG: alpha-mannosidase [Anaerolineaceae bacterium]|nr:alpha-mannosidase [Anaerolineaceae bacterium]
MYHAQRWTLEKIKDRLDLIAPLVYRKSEALPAFRFTRLESPVSPPPVGKDVDDSNWAEIRPFDYWGTWFTDFVLRSSFSVPADWDSSRPAALFLPIGEAGDFSHPEALAYIDGKPFAACDRHHQEILLDDSWRDGKTHVLALHGWTGLGGFANGEMMSKLFMRMCQVVQIDPPTRDFLALARTARETAANLDANNPARARLLNALNEAFNVLETRDPLGDAFYASVKPALAALKAGLAQAGDPQDVVIHATGHAHIDVAWLWTLGQTRRKSERTFQNALRLMEQFPDYHFSQSQPQLYEFIRQDQPELFEGIRQKVAEGRWEPMGGMWVEADCNLSGAESLARQFLLGRNYFRKYFGEGADSPLLWLPDVFGYAWALPQLIKQAGLKYFMTIKIGWSQYNRLPYDTFMWQGIDGTQILTHFSTVKEEGSPFASTYNAMANAKEALGTWSNFQQKELHKDLLMAYGFGDGGGGPTREMLENIEVMGEMPGLPQVKQSSVRKFFESIEPAKSSRMMPVWNGELYLEYHRGTYTTQARNKKANRKSEFLMHDSEFLAVYAALLDPNYAYPAPEFTQAWQTICLNQFHDIIPGSSIGPVYEESLAQYAQVAQDMAEVKEGALRSLATRLGGDVLLANPAPFARHDLAFVPGESKGGLELNGKALDTQVVEGGLLVDAGELAPYSVAALTAAAGKPAQAPAVGDAHVLENDLLRVEFNQAGDITRVYDKAAGREVLPAGAVANQLLAFEDRPKDFDAWDIDIYYDDKTYLAEPKAAFKVLEAGPLRRTVEIKRRIMNSEVTQRISLRRNSARLDFDTSVDWKERHTMLKVAFPVDVLAPQATYEIQWGNVQRPTHRNTSWDWARFETCAHKWVDLSEGDYGVSLLNDCKYGHDIHDNVMRITLLRSPTMPDPAADLGTHQFTYSLYPHSGSWDERVQAEAYALNDPIVVYRAEKGAAVQQAGLEALVSASSPNLVVETIKQAEDGDGIVVRLYESRRSRGPAALRFAFPVKAAWETNLLEETERELEVAGNEVRFDVRPFQILTVKVKRG